MGTNAQDQILKELLSMRQEHKTDHGEVMEKLQSIETNNEALKGRTDKLETKVKLLDKDNRKRNIVIYGVEEKEGESIQDLQLILSSILNVKLECDLQKGEIDDFFRLGKKSDRSRPILIKLVSYWRKRELMSKSSKLKGSKISLANDLSPEDATKMKTLRQEMKDLRTKGHDVRIRGLTLLVDGVPRNNIREQEELESMDTTIVENKSETSAQKRQLSPEPNGKIRKQTDTEESLKKKSKLQTSSPKASNLGQVTLQRVGIQLTERKATELDKRNLFQQHSVQTLNEANEGVIPNTEKKQ